MGNQQGARDDLCRESKIKPLRERRKTGMPVKSSKMKFDKELFKRSVQYNVRTLYRKTMEEQ